MEENLTAIFGDVLDGKIKTIQEDVNAAINARSTPENILYEAMIPAMEEVGSRFERQELFVPEMMLSARTMQSGLLILRPLLVGSAVRRIGRVAIGTVQGDMHDIGKNLVGMMLEGAGFELIDLGTNVPADRFVEAAQDGADLIGLSALLTTTMGNMGLVVDALEKANVRRSVKVIVGGAPVNEGFAEEIRADGYAPNASQAVKLARALLAPDRG